jgi:broad specificity phosphatase PhoE
MTTSRDRRSIAGRGLACLLALGALACSGEPNARAEAPAPARAASEGKGVRTLYLVRHGAYDEDDASDPDVGKHLVPLGRQQADLVAARLKALPRPPEAVHASTMSRARETAEVVAKALELEPVLSRDLRECQPPRRVTGAVEPADAAEEEECRQQVERALARLFKSSPDRDRSEVVVAHGNVIRYLACRALGVDPLAWNGFGITHTGLTTILVRPDGRMKVLSYNDVGHLPPELQTERGKEPLAAVPTPY